jgi:hypothetical protein
MDLDEFSRKHSQAVGEFNDHERRGDGIRVASSLAAGLSVLRDALYFRMHEDVERVLGRDSMLMPVSELKAQRLTKIEIEVYQIAESGAAAKEFGYTGATEWYVEWLARVRLAADQVTPAARKGLADYLALSPEKRVARFEGALAKVLPESTRAPLVLFRLFPVSVQIATALAFADHGRAPSLRHAQTTVLPSILDCRACHGKVLENGESCPGCGNPLWKFSWLTSAD